MRSLPLAVLHCRLKCSSLVLADLHSLRKHTRPNRPFFEKGSFGETGVSETPCCDILSAPSPVRQTLSFVAMRS